MSGVLAVFVDNLFVFGVVLSIIGIYLSRRYGFYVMKIEEDTGQQTTSWCTNKTCVRCNYYKTVVECAGARLNNVGDNAAAINIQSALLPQYELCQTAKQKPNVLLYPNLPSRPLWNPDELDDVAIIRSAFSAIRQEFLAVYNEQDLQGWKQNRTPIGSWDVYPLIDQGEVVPNNAKMCPETMATLKSLSSALTSNVFGNVMFSVVKPSTLITEHYGPSNIRLRCHLGLVTTPYCCLRIDDEELIWTTGDCIVFDDSFLHSVSHDGVPDEDLEFSQTADGASNSNDTDSILLRGGSATSPVNDSNLRLRSSGGAWNERSDEPTLSQGGLGGAGIDRAVLIVDLWHPGLTRAEREAIDTVFAPVRE